MRVVCFHGGYSESELEVVLTFPGPGPLDALFVFGRRRRDYILAYPFIARWNLYTCLRL